MAYHIITWERHRLVAVSSNEQNNPHTYTAPYAVQKYSIISKWQSASRNITRGDAGFSVYIYIYIPARGERGATYMALISRARALTNSDELILIVRARASPQSAAVNTIYSDCVYSVLYPKPMWIFFLVLGGWISLLYWAATAPAIRCLEGGGMEHSVDMTHWSSKIKITIEIFCW